MGVVARARARSGRPVGLYVFAEGVQLGGGVDAVFSSAAAWLV